MITLILLTLPIVAAFVTWFSPKGTAKNIALFFTLAELATAIYAYSIHVLDASTQSIFVQNWIPSLGIQFKIGMDGISLLMVLLTAFLYPLIVLSSFKKDIKNQNAFYALMLFMQAGLIGVFVSLDAFLFYVAWEAALIPIYFISAIWGGENRIKITLKFFVYTIFGSLFMLAGIIYLYLQTQGFKTFDIGAFYNLNLSSTEQSYLFWTFFLAFAIKMPIFPFHTWQPDTYTEAPTQGTMLLSGIMLKMGIYGVIRWMIPIVPQGVETWSTLAITLSIIGIVYGSIIAIRQTDIKRLIAYSSIAHVGLIAAGVFVWNQQSVQGAVIQMLNHGISVVALFFIIQIIEDRTGTRDIPSLGGIVLKAPILAICFVIVMMGAVALPLTNGFIGEFLLLMGIYKYNVWAAVIAGSTIILGAVYMLRMYQKVMLGESNSLTSSFTDIKGTEQIVLFVSVLVIIVVGVYPNFLLKISEAPVSELINFANTKLVVK
jgi:NADH-quinone oxidoreductase subunit M